MQLRRITGLIKEERQEAKTEAEAEAKAKAKAEAALMTLVEKLNDETICKYSDLTLEELAQHKNSLQ